jgi:hypothetical protein
VDALNREPFSMSLSLVTMHNKSALELHQVTITLSYLSLASLLHLSCISLASLLPPLSCLYLLHSLSFGYCYIPVITITYIPVITITPCLHWALLCDFRQPSYSLGREPHFRSLGRQDEARPAR